MFLKILAFIFIGAGGALILMMSLHLFPSLAHTALMAGETAISYYQILGAIILATVLYITSKV